MPGPTPCTRCGAPLPETDGPRVCALCGQFHAPAGAGPRFGARAAPGGGAPGGSAPAGSAPPPRPDGRPDRAQMSPRARARGTGAVGCVILLAIGVPIAVVIGALVLAVVGSDDRGDDGAVGGADLAPTTGDLLVLPGDLGDDPTVVTMATPIGGDGGRVVALVELEDGPVWEASIVPDDVYSAQFAATDDVVVASLGRAVVGLDRATGDVLWEGEASDEVHPFCVECFALVDGTLVVTGNDGEVTAFDPASGEVRWEHRFTSPGGRAVPVGDAVLLVDDAPEGHAPSVALGMVLVRPSDGSELSRFTPGCPDEGFSGVEYTVSATPRLPIVPVPGTDDVVLVYGSISSCVQRWDVTTGEQRWSRFIPDADLAVHDFEDRAWAVSDTELVLAAQEGWLVVGLAEGGAHVVPAAADTMPSATVALAGDRFVAAVSTVRGTPEWSLVAHDLRTGDPLWDRSIGADHEAAVVGPESSSEYVYDSTLFAVLPAGDDLRLLTIGPPGPRFAVAEVDPDSGEGGIVGVAPLRTDNPTSVGARIDTVRDGRALIDVDGVLQVLDLATGEVGAAWGR